MIEYMEFPDNNASTVEGKVQQIDANLVRLVEKTNRLIEAVNTLLKDKGD